MLLNQFVATLTPKVKGTHTPYDDNRSVLVIPTGRGRVQSVILENIFAEDYRYILVSSKICAESKIPDKLFKREKNCTFCRLAIRHGFLQAVAYLDENMNPDLAAAIVTEVANFADEQEESITGEDIY
ncbi:MAG TPA: hypothetical protein ENJ39_01310 [Flammeovirgaceae bacterium]|nr:hypothetical protein [Flammeovirgaceae bacterium]